VKEEAKLLQVLSIIRYSKFVWSILRSIVAIAAGGRGVPHDRRERARPEFENHHIPSYGSHFPNHQGTIFDLKKKKVA